MVIMPLRPWAKPLKFGAPKKENQLDSLPSNLEQARYNMIEQQIRPWDVLDPRVLETLQLVRREEFVPAEYRTLAFTDMNVPLPHGQVMMSPKLEARLLQELALSSSDKVLEIGTGSGYMTALLASSAGEVDSVDIFTDFTDAAREKLAAIEITNVNFITGDGAQGWQSDEQYDAILLTGSVPAMPPAYPELLAPGGRLLAIVGVEPIMEAVLWQRDGNNPAASRSLFDTSIPPLVGAELPPAFVF